MIAQTIAIPADGPSFGVAPWGKCTWSDAILSKRGRGKEKSDDDDDEDNDTEEEEDAQDGS